ncbi:hypothetical protein Gohar_020238, partial [Gossypium harknessii]|nr:hypothetical protein [Gossypium harknessii]
MLATSSLPRKTMMKTAPSSHLSFNSPAAMDRLDQQF